MGTTTNFRKHTTKNPINRFFIRLFLHEVIEKVKELQPKNILDVGCGEGFTLASLEKAGVQVTFEGIDNSRTALQLAKRQHPKFKLRYGSIYALPYATKSFDLVICTEVLEHLEEPEKALKELKRVAKKHVLLSVPNEPYFSFGSVLKGKMPHAYNEEIGHINHWSKNAFIGFVEEYLTIVAVRTPFPWTMVVAGK